MIWADIAALLVGVWVGIRWIAGGDGRWEPILAVVLLVFPATDLYRRLRSGPKPNASDVALFDRYMKLLGSPDLVRFFKEHDFGGSFRRRDVASLHEFVETWDNAVSSFIDKKLEAARMTTYAAASSLATAIATHTTPRQGGDTLSVKPENLPAGPTPQWVLDGAREINKATKPFVDAHEALVKLGRKRLA